MLRLGLGQRGVEFDKVFMDTFQLVVLRGEKPRAVLDREAETLNHLMTEIGAPCWQPDPPSPGACCSWSSSRPRSAACLSSERLPRSPIRRSSTVPSPSSSASTAE